MSGSGVSSLTRSARAPVHGWGTPLPGSRAELLVPMPSSCCGRPGHPPSFLFTSWAWRNHLSPGGGGADVLVWWKLTSAMLQSRNWAEQGVRGPNRHLRLWDATVLQKYTPGPMQLHHKSIYERAPGLTAHLCTRDEAKPWEWVWAEADAHVSESECVHTYWSAWPCMCRILRIDVGNCIRCRIPGMELHPGAGQGWPELHWVLLDVFPI